MVVMSWGSLDHVNVIVKRDSAEIIAKSLINATLRPIQIAIKALFL